MLYKKYKTIPIIKIVAKALKIPFEIVFDVIMFKIQNINIAKSILKLWSKQKKRDVLDLALNIVFVSNYCANAALAPPDVNIAEILFF